MAGKGRRGKGESVRKSTREKERGKRHEKRSRENDGFDCGYDDYGSYWRGDIQSKEVTQSELSGIKRTKQPEWNT